MCCSLVLNSEGLAWFVRVSRSRVLLSRFRGARFHLDSEGVRRDEDRFAIRFSKVRI